jgi:hypothetical protein
VAVALAQQGHPLFYEEDSFEYVVRKSYTPDFKIPTTAGGFFYLETKGRFTSADRKKTLEFKRSHVDVPLLIAFQNPYQRLTKKSVTTYADWCNKYGIPWCPIPIPQDFLQQWVNGSRPTSLVRHARVQMRLL